MFVYPFTRTQLGKVWIVDEDVPTTEVQNIRTSTLFEYCARRADLPKEMVEKFAHDMEINGGGSHLDRSRLAAWRLRLYDPKGSVRAGIPCPHCHRVNHVRMADVAGLHNISAGLSCDQLGRSCSREDAPFPAPLKPFPADALKREELRGAPRTPPRHRRHDDSRYTETNIGTERYYFESRQERNQEARAPTPDEWRNLERFVAEEAPQRMVPLLTSLLDQARSGSSFAPTFPKAATRDPSSETHHREKQGLKGCPRYAKPHRQVKEEETSSDESYSLRPRREKERCSRDGLGPQFTPEANRSWGEKSKNKDHSPPPLCATGSNAIPLRRRTRSRTSSTGTEKSRSSGSDHRSRSPTSRTSKGQTFEGKTRYARTRLRKGSSSEDSTDNEEDVDLCQIGDPLHPDGEVVDPGQLHPKLLVKGSVLKSFTTAPPTKTEINGSSKNTCAVEKSEESTKTSRNESTIEQSQCSLPTENRNRFGNGKPPSRRSSPKKGLRIPPRKHTWRKGPSLAPQLCGWRNIGSCDHG